VATTHDGDSTKHGQVITIRDVVRFLRHGAPFAVFVMLVAGASAYLFTSASTPVYSARVGVVATPPRTQFAGMQIIAPPSVDPGVYQSAILDGHVASDALLRLTGSVPSEQELADFLRSVRVRIQSGQPSSIIWIEVRDSSPTRAADAANLLAEELIIWDRDRAHASIDRSLAAIERSIGDLDAEIAAASAANDAALAQQLTQLRNERANELEVALAARSRALVVGLLEPLRLAVPPERPVGPRVLFSTLVASLLGLVFGYGLQLVRGALDTRVGSRDQIIAATGRPVLAEFPRRPRRAFRLSSEAASFFRTNVTLATRDANPRVIVISCPSMLSEKLGVAVSLAESFARSGQRTLLVDADMRHPAATEWLDVVPSHAAPLEVYLANPDRRYRPISVSVGSRRSFDFVPSFTSAPYPVDLLNEGVESQLDTWKSLYDVIVLDATPVLPYADTLAIAPYATGLVLSVSAVRSPRDSVLEALDVLDGAGVRVLGLVLTEVRRRDRHPVRSDFELLERQASNQYKTMVPESREAITDSGDRLTASPRGRAKD
jgi:polysaccharide biosynthesis transport protein